MTPEDFLFLAKIWGIAVGTFLLVGIFLLFNISTRKLKKYRIKARLSKSESYYLYYPQKKYGLIWINFLSYKFSEEAAKNAIKNHFEKELKEPKESKPKTIIICYP